LAAGSEITVDITTLIDSLEMLNLLGDCHRISSVTATNENVLGVQAKQGCKIQLVGKKPGESRIKVEMKPERGAEPVGDEATIHVGAVDKAKLSHQCRQPNVANGLYMRGTEAKLSIEAFATRGSNQAPLIGKIMPFRWSPNDTVSRELTHVSLRPKVYLGFQETGSVTVKPDGPSGPERTFEIIDPDDIETLTVEPVNETLGADKNTNQATNGTRRQGLTPATRPTRTALELDVNGRYLCGEWDWQSGPFNLNSNTPSVCKKSELQNNFDIVAVSPGTCEIEVSGESQDNDVIDTTEIKIKEGLYN
jgi:hypothetical protein